MAINPWGWGLGGIGYGLYGGSGDDTVKPKEAETPLQQFITKGDQGSSGLSEMAEPRDPTANEFTHYGFGIGSLDVPDAALADVSVSSRAFNPAAAAASLVGAVLGPIGTSGVAGKIAADAMPGATRTFGTPTTHLTGRSVPDTVNLAQQPGWMSKSLGTRPGFQSFLDDGPPVTFGASPASPGMVASAIGAIDAALGLGASGKGRTAAELQRDMAFSGRPDAHGPGGIGRGDVGNLG